MSTGPSALQSLAFLADGGAMGARFRAFDWAATPLGAAEAWPQSLRTLVGVMLGAGQPMFIAWGPEHTLLYNDAYGPLLGAKEPGALGRPFMDVWAEAQADLQPLFDRVRSGEPVHMDDIGLMLDRSGRGLEEAHFAFSYTPVRDESGAVVGLFCPCVDTTAEVLGERALREGEERLRLVVEGARDHAIITTDLEGTIVSWSAGAEGVFGWSAAEAIGQSAELIFTPEDRAIGAATGEMETARADGCAEDKRWHLCKDGRRVFMNGSMHVLHHADGAEAGFIKIARDETERREQETILRASERRLQAVLESVSDGFYALDVDWRFTVFNGAAEGYFGVSREAVLGRDFWELFPQGRGTEFETLMRALMAGGEPFRFEAPSLTRPDRVLELRAARKQGGGIAVAFSDITERKASEARIRESEATLRAFFDTEGLYASVIELDGDTPVYVAGNRAFSAFFGRESLESVKVETLIGRRAAAQGLELLKRVEQSGQPVMFEHPAGMADGSEHWFSATMSPVGDGQGRRRFAAVSVDITERRRAEEALRDSEARFRAITETLPQIVWSTLPDGYHDYFNRRWYEFTGVPDGSTDGEGWNGVFHPDDQPRSMEVWNRSLATGEDYNIEYRLRRRDGVFRWVLGRARAVRDPATNAIVRWMGTCTDIQDIVEAREVLARSRGELEQLVEERTAERDRLWMLSEDMLARADYTGKLLAVSPSWTRVLGYSEDELLTRPYADIIHPENVESVTEALNSMRASGAPTRFENRILASDGVWKPIEWTVAPEPNGVYFIAVGRDISEEKARKLELEQAQEQLRQAQKMEAVGQLTGGIAHDFNNLLQGITGSLDLIQKRVAQGRTNELDRFISGAMTSANRAAALTHRLLAFSRRQPLDPKPVRANPLLAGMEDLLRRTMGESIELELVLAGGLWPTLCDPNQLESAILNLVINARDAMPDGGKLTIETCNAHLDSAYAAATRDVEPGQYVCICVTDTGTGMPAEVIERAFDPFFTTKPIGQGTGLGLSMIYGFARQSEGYCKIYSEVGEGTTIKLYLPRHRGEALEDDAPPELDEHHAAEAGEVVVVIEDEPVVRGLIVEVLAELGYSAQEASDGRSGLQLLEKLPRVDLLITDIGLPGMNGRQLVDAARVSRPGLKVLFMTGYAENAAIANGFLEPGMSMITKPFAIEALATRVRDIIEGPLVV